MSSFFNALFSNLNYTNIQIFSIKRQFFAPLSLKNFKAFSVDAVSNIEQRIQKNVTRSKQSGSISLAIWTKWIKKITFFPHAATILSGDGERAVP